MRALIVLALAAVLTACERTPETHGLQGQTMGTTWSVQWVGDGTDSERLRQVIGERLEELNDGLSTWIEDSEISRLNRTDAEVPVAISADLLAVLEEAGRMHAASDGAYDISVEPLMRLWGFRGEDLPAVPAPTAIEAELRRIDFDLLELDAETGVATKRIGDLELDVSSIAKGYAVDALSTLLDREGLGRHLVEIGGEVRARGRRADGESWRIAIERPESLAHEPQPIVPLDDKAIATSGDYRLFFEKDGQRYAHILDPRTGEPPRSTLASVTVLASSTMTADALATTFMVLGAPETLAWAERDGLAVYLVERTEDGHRALTSTFMDRLLAGKE